MLRLNENKMKVKQQKGLTLIEILVVVAILLLVLIAVFRVFRVDVNRGRDAERKSDLRDIKLAFEDYYNDHGAYPPEAYLANCDGDALRPYLRLVPCDPNTGEPYLYIPYPGGGDNSGGYRVLSILTDHSDPIIAQLGCENGCGLDEDHPQFGESLDYVYGIAEGVPLVLEGATLPTPTPSATPTASPTPLDPSYCDTHLCYCCANSAYTSDQDCNIWVQGNNCDMGPYTSISTCYSSTPCAPQ